MRREKTGSSRIASLDGEVRLFEIWQVLRTNIVVVLLSAFLFGAIALTIALISDDVYRAEAVLIPADESQSPQLGAQLGFAANLAGVDISRPDDKVVKAIATLRSREFLSKFIIEHNISPWLFASDFNKSEGRSEIREDVYDLEGGAWLGADDSTPTNGEILEEFQRAVVVREDQSTGIVTLAVEWKDPFLAAQWANLLIADVNDHLRAADMQEAERAIIYLRDQLSSTPLIEMQRVFYQLIESQTRTLMLGDIREGYVFEVIDPAIAPEKKSKPLTLLSTLLGTLIGGILAAFFVLIRHFAISE